MGSTSGGCRWPRSHPPGTSSSCPKAHILQHSDMVATVPERLAQALVGPFGLAYIKHPAPLPEIAINMFCHAKYHKDPANEWLRGMVFRLHADQSSSAVDSVR